MPQTFVGLQTITNSVCGATFIEAHLCPRLGSPCLPYIQENLYVGVGVVHVRGITAALLGLIGPIQAAMIHLGPDILVFVNSVKLLRVTIKTA